MSKYVKQMNNSELSSVERKNLSDVMELIEMEEYYHGGWKNINGGYAECEFYDYDDETVYFELRSGEQDMGSGSSVEYVDNLSLERVVLQDSKLSPSEMAILVR